MFRSKWMCHGASKHRLNAMRVYSLPVVTCRTDDFTVGAYYMSTFDTHRKGGQGNGRKYLQIATVHYKLRRVRIKIYCSTRLESTASKKCNRNNMCHLHYDMHVQSVKPMGLLRVSHTLTQMPI